MLATRKSNYGDWIKQGQNSNCIGNGLKDDKVIDVVKEAKDFVKLDTKKE